MNKPLLAAFAALAIAGASAAPAAAGTRKPAPATHAVTFAGSVSFACSGSVVRFPDSRDSDPALVMSVGHCVESGLIPAGEVLVDQPSSRTFGLLDSAGTQVATLTSSKLAYATMTDTDVALYELTTTYGEIRSSYGVNPLTIQDTHPTAGTPVTVVSGYWKQTDTCDIDGFTPQLKEAEWTFDDSVRLSSGCQLIGGDSGSPVIDSTTGRVVAVANTVNEDGESCTLNNPCEVAADGTVTVRPGTGYGQETYQIPACFGRDSQLDLSAKGCKLPKP